jgi:hypothetical protein
LSWDETEDVYYKDSADATVAVETTLEGKQKDELVLRINGKQDDPPKATFRRTFVFT